MKTFVCVLSAAVAAGLLAYFAFDAMHAFGLSGNRVMVNISVFIGFIASLTLLAALLAVTFRSGVSSADDRLVARLEERIRALENSGAPGPGDRAVSPGTAGPHTASPDYA